MPSACQASAIGSKRSLRSALATCRNAVCVESRAVGSTAVSTPQALITGSATDVYTIEDDTGWVEEIVDNTRYDPFTWVMSGEGGGQFAYMSVYGLNDDASGGELETVSRLDNSISGWSYDAFLAENGRYRFVELQLSPNEDGAIEAPYQWVLCVGDIGRSDARIEEFLLTGDELRLPREGLGLDLSADALSMEAARRGQRLSLLTLTDERLSYTEYRK